MTISSSSNLIMRFFLTFPSGDNVVIEDSYVWDGVEIQNNSHISKSLVCDNVLVKQYVFMNFNVWPTSSKKFYSLPERYSGT